MDLAERLRRLGYTTGQPAPVRPVAAGPAIDKVVEGEWRETPLGRCFVAARRYPLTHQHGEVRLGDLLGLDGRALSRMGRDPALAGLDLRRLVFLDTETTGLAGGTGTYAFLVGVGFLADDGLVVEQYFMADYGQEPALLWALDERLRDFSAVGSFNGRCFDWPLLETRYALARRRPALADPLHLDVLFPARRVWRERVGGCSLASLEQSVLRVSRASDVPGWLIPSIYFRYVRERDARPLKEVFAHNEQDILSLAALTARLARLFHDPLAATHAEDLYSLGRAFESDGDWEQCILCYEGVARANVPARLREAALCRLGLAYKRLRKAADAEQVWRSLVSRPDCLGVLPYVELAKHLEHKKRNYAEAALVVERALALLARKPLDPWDQPRARREWGELQHRLARLRAKMAANPRSAPGGPAAV